MAVLGSLTGGFPAVTGLNVEAESREASQPLPLGPLARQMGVFDND